MPAVRVREPSSTHATRRWRPVDWAACFGGALLLVWGLVRGFGEPLLAIPDRGDFYRVGTPAGIVVARADVERRTARLTYELGTPQFSGVPPSGSLVVLAARALPAPGTGSEKILDVRQVGFLYTLLLGTAVGAALRFGLPPFLGLLFVWASLGPARLALQNSLLTEPAALVALAALTALLAVPGGSSPTPARARGMALVLGSFALVGGFARASASLLPLALVVAVAASPMWRSVPERRQPWRLVGLLLLAGLPVLHAMRGDGARFRPINVYHAVFRGAALLSPEPGQVLARLGVGSAHVARVGSSYFDGPIPQELTARLAEVSRLQIAVELVREPRAIAEAFRSLTRSLAEEWTPWGGEVRPEAFEWWTLSSLHPRLFRAAPALLWLGVLGAAAFCLRPGGPARAAGLFLGLTFVSQLVVTVLGDGLFALGRHLILARAAAQLLVVLALWDAGAWLIARYAPKPGTST